MRILFQISCRKGKSYKPIKMQINEWMPAGNSKEDKTLETNVKRQIARFV